MNVWNIVEENRAYGIGIRREIHRHPELSGKETNTTSFLRRELVAMGAEIVELGLLTGVVADIRGTKEGNGKVVAIRADIDALPVKEETDEPFSSECDGISHACGHDTHTAALLLAAKVLSEHRDAFSGTVRLMFQPAEEIGCGARTLIEHGVLDDLHPDYVLGLHTWPDTPAGKVGVRFGASHASSDTIKITVRGKGGHGAHPYRCVDPVVAACFMVTQLQTVISRELAINDGGVLTFGLIQGGTAPNVIPGEVHLEGTLRALDPQKREQMLDSIRRIAHSCCEAMRAQAEVTVVEGMPPLVNDLTVIGMVKRSAVKALGEENVEELKNASPGSDDFAFYLERFPGAMFRIGTGNEDPATHIGLHNGKNRFDERCIPAGAAVLIQFVLDSLL
ncbi:MAG: amidohydrolase [Clostridia bacterium]|nr:amidohydrolase [Clostridia bacterium]